MDFDFGNLIYILLMIAFVVFGSKGKKKKRPIPVQDEQDDSVSENTENPIVGKISENLKKYFGEQFNVESSLDEAEEEIEENLEYDTQFDSYSDSDAYVEGEGHVRSSYDRIEEEKHIPYDYEKKSEEEEILARKKKIKTANPKAAFTHQLLSEFNPKKAFLYSEIFKPKYF